LYIDGENTSFTANDGGTFGGMGTGTSDLHIGRRTDGATFFNGTMDEVTIWNRRLSATEIRTLYNIGISPISNESSFTTSAGSTDFDTVANMSSISNMILATANANIVWNNPVNGTDQDFDEHITFGSGFVSINSSGLDSSINSSANVTLIGECSRCNSNDIIYSAGVFTTLAGIRANGQSCGLAGTCSNFVCTGGEATDCTFTASSFTGFGAGGNANLTINDSAEGSSVETDIAIDFFAFYVNATDGTPITPTLGGSCNVSFDDGGTVFVMSFNGTGNNAYNFTKTAGFSTAGTHLWNATCGGGVFSLLTVNDTVEVTLSSDIPEFSDYALILALMITICGFFFIRKKE